MTKFVQIAQRGPGAGREIDNQRSIPVTPIGDQRNTAGQFLRLVFIKLRQGIQDTVYHAVGKFSEQRAPIFEAVGGSEYHLN